jgi:HSP20 family protein
MNAIERWNPFQELETMRNWMDRWFDEGFGRNAPAMFTPAVDLVQTETGYELHANLPGFKPEEVDINVEKDTVTIKAKHEEQQEKTEKNYLYRERRSGTFYRSFRLPEVVDAEKAEAKIDNGVVVLTLPRLAQAQGRKLEIKTNNGNKA